MAVIVIGGGITGLSAAWSLVKAGEEVTVVEPGPFGGLLRTEQIDGCTMECGADSWIRTKPWLRDLAIELGLGEDIIRCHDTPDRTRILRHGKLTPLPRGLRMFVPTEWRPILTTPLIGTGTKARMLLETGRRPSRRPDCSIAEFVRDHFGQEAVEYLAEPLFAGVYGGDPETLGVRGVLPRMLDYEREYGSLIRGARREPGVTGPLFESMRGGLGQIPEVLVARLKGRVSFVRARAEQVEPGRVRVAGDWMPASHVVVACGASQAAKLLAGFECGRLLAAIPHSSATIFALGFRTADLGREPRGFGFLVPRKERHTILAATWVTNKFPHRAPPGWVVARCFVAGDHSEGLISDVRADLARIAGVTAEPRFARVYRWPHSMPQYGVGHAELLSGIRNSLPADISVVGAFSDGVGMPDCARAGSLAARDLLTRPQPGLPLTNPA